jgi:hypothetical protein
MVVACLPRCLPGDDPVPRIAQAIAFAYKLGPCPPRSTMGSARPASSCAPSSLGCSGKGGSSVHDERVDAGFHRAPCREVDCQFAQRLGPEVNARNRHLENVRVEDVDDALSFFEVSLQIARTGGYQRSGGLKSRSGSGARTLGGTFPILPSWDDRSPRRG